MCFFIFSYFNCFPYIPQKFPENVFVADVFRHIKRLAPVFPTNADLLRFRRMTDRLHKMFKFNRLWQGADYLTNLIPICDDFIKSHGMLISVVFPFFSVELDQHVRRLAETCTYVLIPAVNIKFCDCKERFIPVRRNAEKLFISSYRRQRRYPALYPVMIRRLSELERTHIGDM